MMIAAQSSLKYFEEVEGGYFLPDEHEDEFVDFINGLNNKIIDLQEALKEEREASDKALEAKNERIQNLEQQIEQYKSIVDELEKIIETDKEIINLNNEQKDLLRELLNKWEEMEEINNKIEKSYQEQLDLKDERIRLEVNKRRENVIKYSLISLVVGVVGGVIIAN